MPLPPTLTGIGTYILHLFEVRMLSVFPSSLSRAALSCVGRSVANSLNNNRSIVFGGFYWKLFLTIGENSLNMRRQIPSILFYISIDFILSVRWSLILRPHPVVHMIFRRLWTLALWSWVYSTLDNASWV